MALMINRVKVYKYYWGQIKATINFAFEVKAILGLESKYLESRVVKMGLNQPHNYQG